MIRAVDSIVAAVAAVLLVFGLTGAPQLYGAATINVVDHGACGGCAGSTNRIAFQAAIAAASAGDIVYVPNGTYDLTQAPSVAWAVVVNKSITLRGESRAGAVLRMDASEVMQQDTFRLVVITGDNAAIEDLTFDGNKPNRNTVTVYDPLLEHHTGVFIGPDADSVRVSRVTLENLQGDAVQIYNSSDDTVVEDSAVYYTQRNGLSFTPTVPSMPVQRTIIRRNTFSGVTVQSIDNEHGPALDAEIYHNHFGAGSNSYALTMSGYSDQHGHASRSKRWHVYENTFEGGIFAIRAEDGIFERNTFTNPTTKPCLETNRSALRMTFQDNVCVCTQTAVGSVPGFFAVGTQEPPVVEGGPIVWAAPTDIIVRRNTITVSRADSMGVRAEGVASILVEDNTLQGVAAAAVGYSGVSVRATLAGQPVVSAIVRRNAIRDFGQAAVRVYSNANTTINSAVVEGNRFENTRTVKPMTQGVSLSGNSGTLVSVKIGGNVRGCGVAFESNTAPAGTVITSSGLAASSPC